MGLLSCYQVTVQYNRLVAGRRHLTFQPIPQCTSPNMRPPPLPLPFSEETVAKNMKGEPPLFSVTLIALHSEVKSEEKRKNGNEGMGERELLSPAPLSVRLQQTKETPYEHITEQTSDFFALLGRSAVFNIFLRCLAKRPTL